VAYFNAAHLEGVAAYGASIGGGGGGGGEENLEAMLRSI